MKNPLQSLRTIQESIARCNGKTTQLVQTVSENMCLDNNCSYAVVSDNMTTLKMIRYRIIDTVVNVIGIELSVQQIDAIETARNKVKVVFVLYEEYHTYSRMVGMRFKDIYFDDPYILFKSDVLGIAANLWD